MNTTLTRDTAAEFARRFGRPPEVMAFAPGRVEVLGNHTDYNDGFVLSAATHFGICFAAGMAPDRMCRTVAADLDESMSFALSPRYQPEGAARWGNYIKGVFAELGKGRSVSTGFRAVVKGNMPVAAGLSSSAALEMATALGLCALYGWDADPLHLARVGQRAEHTFAGVRTGLLDQVSSLFGRAQHLVLTDFRSLAVRNVPLPEQACFLVCNTGVKHTLIDSAYNQRRADCEAAAAFFARKLGDGVRALRDVDLDQFEACRRDLDAKVAKRAEHVIGENARVGRAVEFLASGCLDSFGRLMFESHESSRVNFENSCPELDFLVGTSRQVPGVLGGRLSGGGFGGCAVFLLHPADIEGARQALVDAYANQFGHACAAFEIRPAGGARLVDRVTG